jgi:hypothetical protein
MYDIESLVRNEIGNFNRKLMAPQPLSTGLPQGFADGGQVGSGYPVAGAGFPTAGADFPKAGIDPSTGKPWPSAGSNFPTAGAGFPTVGLPQPTKGYATGGAVQTPGIQPPPPINEGGDNTMIAAKTGEYVLPDKVAALPAEDIAAKINYLMTKNPNMTAKELFDEITFMTTGTPPNNAGAPAPGAPPPSVGIKPQGFAVGGEVQDPLMGQDVPPTPSMGLPPAPKAEAPAAMPTASQPAMAPSPAPSPAPAAPSVGLKPAATGAPAPGAPPLKPVGIQAIGTAKDPLNKSFTGSGVVKKQPMNSVDIAGDLQHQREAFGQQGQTAPQPQIMVGNPHGISSTVSEADAFQKGLMTPEQRKDYQDRQVQQQQLGIQAKSLDNEAAYRNAALGIKQQEADTKKKAVDDRANPKPLTAHQQWQQEQAKKKEELTSLSSKSLAQMLVKGEISPNQLPKRRETYESALIEAKKLDPNYSPQKAETNYALNRNATFRTREMTAEALPEIMRNVVDAGKKVNYDDVKFKGSVEKWAKGQLNDPAFVEYMVQRNDALMTIAAAMRGNGATDMAHAAETEAMSPTLSPRALDAWMAGQMKSLVPRLQQYQNLGLHPKIIDPQTGKVTDQPVEQSMVVDPTTGKVIVSRDDMPGSAQGQVGQNDRVQVAAHRLGSDMHGFDMNTSKGKQRLKQIHDNFKANGYTDDEITAAFNAFRGVQ